MNVQTLGESFGFSREAEQELRHAWSTYQVPGDPEQTSQGRQDIWTAATRVIQVLFDENPSLPNTLYDTFRFRNFGRYQPVTLSRQLRRYAGSGMADGGCLALLALDDQANPLSDPETKYGVVRPTYREVDSTAEIDEAAIKTSERLGPLSSLIINAHGCSGWMVLDGSNQVNVDNVDEITCFNRPGVFKNTASIVLASCLTGNEGGVAQALSKVTGGLPVYASQNIGSLKIKADSDSGGHELVFSNYDNEITAALLMAIGKACDTDMSSYIETELMPRTYDPGIRYVNGVAEPSGPVNLLS
jgi:hypothetical protein